MFTQYPDGSFIQMLMSYPVSYTEEGIEFDFENTTAEIINDDALLISGRQQHQCASFAEEIIEWVETCVEYDCYSGQHQGEAEQDSCDGEGSQLPYTVCEGAWVVTGCSSGGSGGSNTNPPDDGDPDNTTTGGGGTSTGGSNNNPDEPEIPVIPVAPTIVELIEKCINTPTLNGTNTTFIEPGLIDRLGLSKGEISDMQNYLEYNNCSEAAQEQVLADIYEIFDEQIFIDDAFRNNICLKGIYDNMGKASTIKDYLSNFDGEFSVAHLALKYDENFGENNDEEYHNAMAYTDWPQNYLINIVFNGDVNLSASIHGQPKLKVALAMMHELIHAEIFRKLMSLAQKPDLDFYDWYIEDPEDWRNFVNSLRNNFNGLYDYYMRFEWGVPPGQEVDDAHHQLMAQHYIDIIVDALSDYDNNAHSQEVYEALAWIGLYDTVAWDNLTEQQQSTHITNRQNYENNATDICD